MHKNGFDYTRRTTRRRWICAHQNRERLAQQYWGRSYDDPSDRVIVRVRPDRVHAHRVA